MYFHPRFEEAFMPITLKEDKVDIPTHNMMSNTWSSNYNATRRGCCVLSI